MNLIKAVARLGNKLTGKTYDQKILATMVNQIAEDYSGGGGSGGDSTLVVKVLKPDELQGDFILDKTWQEIYNAIFTTGVFIVRQNIEPGYEIIDFDTLYSVSNDSEQENPYAVSIGEFTFVTNTPDGYPRTYLN